MWSNGLRLGSTDHTQDEANLLSVYEPNEETFGGLHPHYLCDYDSDSSEDLYQNQYTDIVCDHFRSMDIFASFIGMILTGSCRTQSGRSGRQERA